MGETGRTGQHEQVLEEGMDPNLGCFRHFLDVLLHSVHPNLLSDKMGIRIVPSS